MRGRISTIRHSAGNRKQNKALPGGPDTRKCISLKNLYSVYREVIEWEK